MCRSTLVRCLALVALLAALPALAAAPAASAPAPAVPTLALDGGACPDVPATVIDSAAAAPAIGEGDPQPVIGCTATYNCVHGTIVSCSSPVNGTCSASGGGCGSVTCSGQTTWCPGRCLGSHHCAIYCDFAPDAFCDWAGCCDCDG